MLADAAWTAEEGDTRFTDSGKGHTDNYDDPSETEPDPDYPDVAHPWRFQYDCLTFDVLSMTGTSVGPAVSNGDLTGNVAFDIGNGCGEFDYGYVEPGGGTDPGNTAPTARATVKPKVANVDRVFTFDGTGSTDAETPDDLDYVWDMDDGNSPKDAMTQKVRYEYAEPGIYWAKLTVTDPRGEDDTARVKVTVTRRVQCGGRDVQRDGGWSVRNHPDAQRKHYCINDKDQQTAGDSLRMAFKGPRLQVNFGRAQNGGTAQVFVDGERIGQVSFTGPSAGPTFGFKKLFTGLGDRQHTTRLVVDKPSNGHKYAYFDSFTIAGTVG